MEKRLYRSRENKVISGVCGGIADYFEVDPTFIGLLWAVSVCLHTVHYHYSRRADCEKKKGRGNGKI